MNRYGYGPYTGCGPASMPMGPMPTVGAYPGGYGLAPYPYGQMIVGADAPAEKPGVMQQIKDAAAKETFGIKRGYLALGALAIGGILVASHKGML